MPHAAPPFLPGSPENENLKSTLVDMLGGDRPGKKKKGKKK
jgi:hypothetical protein